MRATRAYIAGFGTAGSVLAGCAVLFVVASAIVAFRGWPKIVTLGAPVALRLDSPVPAGGSRVARRLAPLLAGAPSALATGGRGRRGLGPAHGRRPASGLRRPPATGGTLRAGQGATGSPNSGSPVSRTGPGGGAGSAGRGAGARSSSRGSRSGSGGPGSGGSVGVAEGGVTVSAGGQTGVTLTAPAPPVTPPVRVTVPSPARPPTPTGPTTPTGIVGSVVQKVTGAAGSPVSGAVGGVLGP